MAVWLPVQNQFYLPPKPIPKVMNTDEYVQRTSVFYYAGSERLLTVGHPFYEQRKENDITIPKVSPNQYRVFRLRFPDPNKFAFDKKIFDPETERMVWSLRGLEIGRGQPLGTAISGNPLFNRFDDVENPARYNNSHAQAVDSRQSVAFDPKQTQMFLVGCIPATGEHWGKAARCRGQQNGTGDCPPIELVNTVIEDGDMFDIGLGAMDFASLQVNKSDAPLDISDSICKYVDYIKMANESHGDSMFFYARRESVYARHFFSRGGAAGEEVPNVLFTPGNSNQAQTQIATPSVFSMPSGSLISSDSQIFNRPYWLQRAQGNNNGIAWGNQLFVTVADNTRGTTLCISTNANGQKIDEYKNDRYKEYLRHVEEFEIGCILQLCKIKLSPETLAFVHSQHPDVVDDWNLTVTPPGNSTLEDTYRYISSLATKCPDDVPPKEKEDPYKEYKFWEVDMTEKMSEQLDQFPLGRKFLFQSGLNQTTTSSTSVSRAIRPRGTKRKRASK